MLSSRLVLAYLWLLAARHQLVKSGLIEAILELWCNRFTFETIFHESFSENQLPWWFWFWVWDFKRVQWFLQFEPAFFSCDEISWLLFHLQIHSVRFRRNKDIVFEKMWKVCHYSLLISTNLPVESEMNPHFVCLPDTVNVNQSFVNFILT